MHPLDQFLQSGAPLHVAADGQMSFAKSPSSTLTPTLSQRARENGGSPAKILLPGSFNPIHAGHWRLAEVAAEMVGLRVAFEMSVVNVDKPALTRAEIRRRLAQFDGQAAVWLTHAARFVEKAEWFPGAVFVVGADTALRIVAPGYYDDAARMTTALERVQALGCRFLVACRADARGQCLRKSDLAIPSPFVELFEEIPPERFRWDISSTEIRDLERDLTSSKEMRF